MELQEMPKPGLKLLNNSEDVWDDLRIKKLDRLLIDQNLFLEYHGGEEEDEVAILPINLKVGFYIGLRKGIGGIDGHH